MDERPHPRALADDRKFPPPQIFHHRAALAQRCARTIESSITEHDTLYALHPPGNGFEILQSLQCAAERDRRSGIEWIFLDLHHGPLSNVRPRRIAL